MTRYILATECTVRVLNDDRVQLDSVDIQGSVAIDSNYIKGVHEIIDSTTKEFAEDMATHAKRIFNENPAVRR